MGDAGDAAYRPAFGLSAEEWAELVRLEQATWSGSRTRCYDGPVRRRLKRLGLIISAPMNPPGRSAVSGFGRRWHPTEEGRKAADWWMALDLKERAK